MMTVFFWTNVLFVVLLAINVAPSQRRFVVFWQDLRFMAIQLLRSYLEYQ